MGAVPVFFWISACRLVLASARIGYSGLIFPFVVWTRRHERNLVKNGNVAIASVLNQAMHARSGSWVTYDFKDAHGTRYQGACTDKTKELFKGMSFLVFYEPGLPTRRVASCESNFEVVLPNEE